MFMIQLLLTELAGTYRQQPEKGKKKVEGYAYGI